MKVTKQAQMAPRTPTYEVDPEEGEYVYTVLVLSGVPHCMQHGPECEHAVAVAAHLAKKRR